MDINRISTAEVEEGARAVYVAARKGITCEPWDALPDWRRIRWHNAYRAAVAVREDVRVRPARTIRFAPLERAS